MTESIPAVSDAGSFLHVSQAVCYTAVNTRDSRQANCLEDRATDSSRRLSTQSRPWCWGTGTPLSLCCSSFCLRSPAPGTATHPLQGRMLGGAARCHLLLTRQGPGQSRWPSPLGLEALLSEPPSLQTAPQAYTLPP